MLFCRQCEVTRKDLKRPLIELVVLIDGDRAMESVETLRQPFTSDYVERRAALNQALDRLLTQIFGCTHCELSRPFTREGKTYRVCMSCGMLRSFDLKTWLPFQR